MNTRNIDTPWEETGVVYFDGDIECSVENLDTKEIFRFSCSRDSLSGCFSKRVFNKFTRFLIGYFVTGRFRFHSPSDNFCSAIDFRLFLGKFANGAAIIHRVKERVYSVIWFYNGSFLKKITHYGEMVDVCKKNSYGTIVTNSFSFDRGKKFISMLKQYEKY